MTTRIDSIQINLVEGQKFTRVDFSLFDENGKLRAKDFIIDQPGNEHRTRELTTALKVAIDNVSQGLEQLV